MSRLWKLLFILLILSITSSVFAQPLPDGVKTFFDDAKTDSERGRIITDYLIANRDLGNFTELSDGLKNYFEKTDDQVALDYVTLAIADYQSRTGDYANALVQALAIIPRFEKRRDDYGILIANKQLSLALYYSGDSESSRRIMKQIIPIALTLNNDFELATLFNNLASDFIETGQPDSGIFYAQRTITYSQKLGDPLIIATALGTLSEGYIIQRKFDLAELYARKSLAILSKSPYLNAAWGFNDLSQIFLGTNQFDSARHYAKLAIALSAKKNYKDQLQRGYRYLAESYEKTNHIDSAYKYFKRSVATKDILFNSEKSKQIQTIKIQEQARQQQIAQSEAELQNNIRTYALLAGLAIVFTIAFMLYRNNMQKQKANKKLENTLSNLKTTQNQLIQSEKMASLGELTAGIAHEIQNPLNFVNNFSELSKELFGEMQIELDNGNAEDARKIAADIIQNLDKINHHGKRADGIVKGMLQHSRTSSGQKAPTDINALCDEYLRLAYHGVRAKDKSFNATLRTNFDSSVGTINVITQDIGRVILNLLTNAFYAVNEKKQSSPDKDYEPTITVQTIRSANNVEITVSDNGNGISASIIDKIFQPFFTTKPTGQGTGLGLSLSYDIVTKGHNGELKVKTKSNEGTTFTILLLTS